MRYTTIIDITAIPELYRNKNAVLLYVHLCLKSGYYDYNRDCYKRSVRMLSAETNLTIAAVRHAIKLLTKHRLVVTKDGVLIVRKYLKNELAPVRKTKEQERLQIIRNERETVQENLMREIDDNARKSVSYEEYLQYKREKEQQNK